MKNIISICLGLLISASATLVTHASESTYIEHTNINPALLYYQGVCFMKEDKATQDYLFETNWIGKHLPKEYGEKIGTYSTRLRFFRMAARQKVPCDWGTDFQGYSTILSHYALMKQMAITAKAEAEWFLQNPENGQNEVAAEDYIAMIALAHNVGNDKFLISVLVQGAIEAMTCSAIAFNYNQFPPALLSKIADGFDSTPPRITVVQALPKEKEGVEWLTKQILEWKKTYGNDDAKVLKEFMEKEFMEEMIPQNSEFEANAQVISKAVGGTTDGLIRIHSETASIYDRIAQIGNLPYPEFTQKMDQYRAEINESTNPLMKIVFAPLDRAFQRDWLVRTRLAMIRAAAEYKAHGEAGFKTVKDPCGNGPFKFERYTFEGKDRGFKLTSALTYLNSPATLIFLEKKGTPIYVDGAHAGEAMPK